MSAGGERRWKTAIIIFHIHKEHRTVDLEVPLDLTAKELGGGA